MRNKRFPGSGSVRVLFAFCMTAVFVLCLPLSLSAAAQGGISEPVLYSGPDAVSRLESEGFQVVYQNLNRENGKENNVYLGCRSGADGSDAVTGLLVSETCEERLTRDGISWLPVSDMNLNAGESGDPLYLYYTTDPEAGAPVTGLYTRTQTGAGDEIFLTGEEEEQLVLTADGEPANLESGKEGLVTYLLMKREKDPEEENTEEAGGTGEEASAAENASERGELRDSVIDVGKAARSEEATGAASAETDSSADSRSSKGILYGGGALMLLSAAAGIFLKFGKGKEKAQ